MFDIFYGSYHSIAKAGRVVARYEQKRGQWEVCDEIVGR